MKIGIIVHSNTGNTYSVAQRLQEVFLAAGYSISLKKVIAVNDKQAELSKIEFLEIPDVSKYDALIFGAPVRAFSLSPVMNAYLSKVESLQGKKVFCFATQYFPYPWMGGDRSINQMKKLCEAKGAEVYGTEIINWSNRKREQKINDLAQQLSKLF